VEFSFFLRNITEIVIPTSTKSESVICALKSLRQIVHRYHCSPYSSLVFRCCLEVLNDCNYEDLAVAVLSTLRHRLGKDFARYEEAFKLRDFPIGKLNSVTPLVFHQPSTPLEPRENSPQFGGRGSYEKCELSRNSREPR
jgi:hypothetical protein